MFDYERNDQGLFQVMYLVVCIVLIILCPGVVDAGYSMHAPPVQLEINPFFSIEEEYTDNIYLSRFDRSDWITTFSPGIDISIYHPRGVVFSDDLSNQKEAKNRLIRLNYTPGFVYFLHNPQHDYTSHLQELEASVQLAPNLTFFLDQNYIRTNEPEFEEIIGVDRDLTRRLRRESRFTINRLMVQPRLTYAFGRENSISLLYRYSAFRSEEHGEDDYREQYINASLDYWFTRYDGIRLIFEYTKGNFDIDADLLNSYGFTGRYIHRFGPRLDIYAEGSLELQDYEERTIGGIIDYLKDAEDEDIYRINAGLMYFFAPDFNVECGFGYYWVEGYHGDNEDGYNFLFAINKTTTRFGYSLTFRKGYEVEHFTLTDAGSYRFWDIAADFYYRYSKRLEFVVSGIYGHRDYSTRRLLEVEVSEDPDREEYIYRSMVGVHYQFMKNILLELDYIHDEIDSTIDADYYIVNRFIWRITIEF